MFHKLGDEVLSVRKPNSPRRRPSTDSLLSTYSFHDDPNAITLSPDEQQRRKRFGVFVKRRSKATVPPEDEASSNPSAQLDSTIVAPRAVFSDTPVELGDLPSAVPTRRTPIPDDRPKSPLAVKTTPTLQPADPDTGARALLPALTKLTACERASIRSVRVARRGSRPSIIPQAGE
jgi:hypothetical protein